MRRRDFVKLAASTGVAWAMDSRASATGSDMPIIDAHIHLFDPSRPGGVPWPKQSDTVLYRPALPERYAPIAVPFGVVGAIAVEASPLASDNDWVLKIAATNPLIVGMVGDLIPGTPSFRSELERLHANPLFLGIRYGNLWDRDLAVDMNKPNFLADLKAFAQLGLELDTANPDPSLIRAIANVSDHLPDMRIVIDHLPHMTLPVEAPVREEYWSTLHRLGKNPNIFVKLSEIPVLADGKILKDTSFYKDKLDAIWDVFGEDRVLFGSDWPNSDTVGSYADTFAIVHSYIAEKGIDASRKFFWKNSIAAYRWHPRQASQENL